MKLAQELKMLRIWGTRWKGDWKDVRGGLILFWTNKKKAPTKVHPGLQPNSGSRICGRLLDHWDFPRLLLLISRQLHWVFAQSSINTICFKLQIKAKIAPGISLCPQSSFSSSLREVQPSTLVIPASNANLIFTIYTIYILLSMPGQCQYVFGLYYFCLLFDILCILLYL